MENFKKGFVINLDSFKLSKQKNLLPFPFKVRLICIRLRLGIGLGFRNIEFIDMKSSRSHVNRLTQKRAAQPLPTKKHLRKIGDVFQLA